MQKLRRGEKGAEGPAPHKPVLLLSVIDLINQGQIRDNKILPSPDLAETFLRYWSKIVVNRARNFAMPFFHLKGDKFWHLYWAFDKGLISLSRTYKVIVSPLMSDRHPTEWLLTEQRDKSILLPEHDLLHPAQDALKWHRNVVLIE